MVCEDNGSNNTRLSENQEDENAGDGYDEDSSSFQSSQSSAYMMDGIGINSAIPGISNINSGVMTTLTTMETEQLVTGGSSTSEEAMKSVLNDFSNVSNTDLNEKVRKLPKTQQQIYLRKGKSLGRKKTTVVKEVLRSLRSFRPSLSLPPPTRRRTNRNGTVVSGYWIKSNKKCVFA